MKVENLLNALSSILPLVSKQTYWELGEGLCSEDDLLLSEECKSSFFELVSHTTKEPDLKTVNLLNSLLL